MYAILQCNKTYILEPNLGSHRTRTEPNPSNEDSFPSLVCVWCRAHTEEREKSEQDRLLVERKLSELFRLLTLDSQYRDISNVVGSLEHVIAKVHVHSYTGLMFSLDFSTNLNWLRLRIIKTPDIPVDGLMFYHRVFFFFFIRPLISELAERNSTISGHVVGLGSKRNLKMFVRNLGYPLPLQIGGLNWIH